MDERSSAPQAAPHEPGRDGDTSRGAAGPRRRRESFDTVAALYDRYRRPVPAEVIADVVASARLRAGSRVLEFGCGTGLLSVPLARVGVELVAVELGPALAAIARRHLAGFPDARVEVAAFEAWPLPAEPFDAVVCANAFHWLDPAVRVARSVQALRAGGTLVIVHPHHIAGGTSAFFAESQRCYLAWGLSDDPDWRLPLPSELPTLYPELDARAEFISVERHRFEHLARFTSASHIGMLRTDSLILGLDEAARRGFLADIAQLIDTRYGGVVERNYLYEVVVARTHPSERAR